MGTMWLRIMASSALLTLAVSGVAWAHVTVDPEEVPAGSFEVLTVRVPSEKDVPTTRVRVEVPEGFAVSRVQPVPGWDYELEKEGGVVTAVAWSGGEIGATEFQQFPMLGATPDEPGEYSWRAIQTYQDGSVVEWTGPPDSEEPASVVEVASANSVERGEAGSLSDGDGAGPRENGPKGSGSRAEEMAETASDGTLPGTGGIGPVVYGIVGAAGGLVLGAALMARLRGS